MENAKTVYLRHWAKSREATLLELARFSTVFIKAMNTESLWTDTQIPLDWKSPSPEVYRLVKEYLARCGCEFGKEERSEVITVRVNERQPPIDHTKIAYKFWCKTKETREARVNRMTKAFLDSLEHSDLCKPNNGKTTFMVLRSDGEDHAAVRSLHQKITNAGFYLSDVYDTKENPESRSFTYSVANSYSWIADLVKEDVTEFIERVHVANNMESCLETKKKHPEFYDALFQGAKEIGDQIVVPQKNRAEEVQHTDAVLTAAGWVNMTGKIAVKSPSGEDISGQLRVYVIPHPTEEPEFTMVDAKEEDEEEPLLPVKEDPYCPEMPPPSGPVEAVTFVNAVYKLMGSAEPVKKE